MAIRTVTIEVKMDISNAEGKITALTGSMKLLGDEVKKTGNSTSDFERLVTRNLRDGESAFESLKRKSTELRGEITRLKSEFHETGGLNVSNDLRRAKADLKGIDNFMKDMVDHAGIDGHRFGDSFGKSFILSFRTFPEFLASPIGGTLTAVLAPALISAVAAAVATGIGLGVVGAGAFIERNDPRIRAVFTPLMGDLQQVMTESASSLVDPIINALGSIDVWAKREQPAFTALFASVAPSVDLITRGIEGFISDLVPALTKVGQTFTTVFSEPDVQASLKAVSASFANIFQTIGNNPKEVADGILFLNGVLKGTFGLLRDIFNFVGPVVADLRQLRTVNDTYDSGIQPGQGTTTNPLTQQQFKAAGGKGSVDDGKSHILKVSRAEVDAAKAAGNFADSQKQAQDMIDAAAAAAENAVPDYAALSSALSKTTATADTLTAQLEAKVFTTMMNSSQATLGWDQALTNVGQTLLENHHIIDENSAGLDLNSKKVLAHRAAAEADRGAILQAVSANQQNYQAMIASGVSATDAAGAYDKNTKALEAQLHKAGLTKSQIHDLIGQYEKVPANINTVLAVKGLTDAINNLDETIRLINHLDGLHADATVTTHYKTIGRPPTQARPNRWGDLYEHADIGLVNAGIYAPPTRYAFAEQQTGGEAFIPKYGNYGRSMNILSAAAGWYGAHVVPGGGRGGGSGGGMTQLVVYGGDAAGKALVKILRFEIYQGGGDPLVVLRPRGA